MGIVASMSRGAWIGTVACLLIFVFFTHRRWLLLAALLVVLTAYPSWDGVCVVRFRRDRAEAERALAGYDFPTARDRLARCLRLWPSERYAERASCPHCGGALDATPR